jgi:TolA-binding protein
MPPEQKPIFSLPRNQFIALVIGVCVLSAAIGSGLALLAQTGPQGPAGKQGPRGHAGKQGPKGPAGESAGEELGELEGEVEELRGAVEEQGEADESGQVEELEERIESLEGELEGFSGLSKELCEEGGFIC